VQTEVVIRTSQRFMESFRKKRCTPGVMNPLLFNLYVADIKRKNREIGVRIGRIRILNLACVDDF